MHVHPQAHADAVKFSEANTGHYTSLNYYVILHDHTLLVLCPSEQPYFTIHVMHNHTLLVLCFSLYEHPHFTSHVMLTVLYLTTFYWRLMSSCFCRTTCTGVLCSHAEACFPGVFESLYSSMIISLRREACFH